jgi:hypothetical protein
LQTNYLPTKPPGKVFIQFFAPLNRRPVFPAGSPAAAFFPAQTRPPVAAPGRTSPATWRRRFTRRSDQAFNL